MIRWSKRAIEAVLIVMACLAPWAFGSVEAQFELCLSVGVVLLAVLGVVVGWKTERSRELFNLPSLALAALAVLGLFQSLPLPSVVLRSVAPGDWSLRSHLLPAAPERVSGDKGPTVPLSEPTLSQDPESTLQVAARLASAWIVFQSVLILGGGYAAFRRFAVAIVVNSTLLALFALIQRLTWNGKIYWIWPAPFGDAGPFVCHNHLAAYLNIGLGFAIAFLLAPRRYGEPGGARLWAGYACGVIVVGIVASLSRSAFLSMTVALVVSVIVLRPRGMVLAAFLGSALVLIPLFLVALGSSTPYQQRLATLLAKAPYSDRLQIWRDALRAWPVDPVFGTGLGSFPTATSRFFTRDNGEGFVHAENEYVEWLVEGGLIGFALVLTVVVGIGYLTRAALRARPDARDRALLLGGVFGGVTLLVHSAADFALHIPGVSVTVVMLCAHLCRAGLNERKRSIVLLPREDALAPRALLPLGVIPGLALVALSLILVVNVAKRAVAESIVLETPIALNGAIPLTSDQKDFNWPKDFDWSQAEVIQSALEDALLYRPDWAEGYVRHGNLLLALYDRWVREGLSKTVKSPLASLEMADPAWLYKEVHFPVGSEPLTVDELLSIEGVSLYLVPAARSFLEARRCNPLLPLPHARLAVLDYLLQGGDPGRVYLERAVRLARADRRLLRIITATAVSLREPEVAADGWKKQLILDPADWEQVADAAQAVLSPDQILQQVVPDGLSALQFAKRLYSEPWRIGARHRFLNEAVHRLPNDTGLTPGERLRFEAEAWARLGDIDKARDRMKKALALAPKQTAWRREQIGWLLEAHQVQEAYDEAMVAVHLAPGDAETQKLLDQAADAVARQVARPSDRSGPSER